MEPVAALGARPGHPATAMGWRLFCVDYFVLSELRSLASFCFNRTAPDLIGGRLIVLGFGVVGSLPLSFALWRYAFRSPTLWPLATA